MSERLIDVVIPFNQEGEHWQHNELRYTLRSIEKNFINLGQVYIVGYLPEYLTNVKHIQASDPYKHNKDANLINKAIIACLDDSISEDFLFTSDDQVFLKPVNYNFFTFPLIDNRQLGFDRTKRLNRWQTRLQRTEIALKQRGYEAHCYEAHIPYLYNKKKYPEVLLSYDYGVDLGYTVSSLYFNSIKQNAIQQYAEQVVSRINDKHETIDSLKKAIGEVIFFNYSNLAFNDVIKEYLQTQFPNKSKFEK